MDASCTGLYLVVWVFSPFQGAIYHMGSHVVNWCKLVTRTWFTWYTVTKEWSRTSGAGARPRAIGCSGKSRGRTETEFFLLKVSIAEFLSHVESFFSFTFSYCLLEADEQEPPGSFAWLGKHIFSLLFLAWRHTASAPLSVPSVISLSRQDGVRS